MIKEEIDYETIMEDPKDKKRIEWLTKHPDKILSWNNFHEIEFSVDVNLPNGIKIWKFPYNDKMVKDIIDVYLRYRDRKRVRDYMKKEGCSEKEIRKELGDPEPGDSNYFPY